MKKVCLFLLLVTSFVSFSQTSKWGVSYAAEFITTKIEISNQTVEADFTTHNFNVHYSILDWSNDFQIGPLVSLRTGNIEGESFSDFQIGLNLGYNFDKIAIVMDTYKVFTDIDNHGIWVFKPGVEVNFNQLALTVGYSTFAYTGSFREDSGIDKITTGGLLLGIKYKF